MLAGKYDNINDAMAMLAGIYDAKALSLWQYARRRYSMRNSVDATLIEIASTLRIALMASCQRHRVPYFRLFLA